MKTRVLSGAVLLAILIPTLVLGGWVLFGLCFLTSVAGVYELLKVKKIEKTVLSVTVLFNLILLYFIVAVNERFILVAPVLLFLELLAIYVSSFPKIKSDLAVYAFFAFFYCGIMISFIYRIRMLEDGAYLVWLIFFASWLCDTCAYFTGVTLGKHKAFPVLSPKKTWEGCVGGVLGSTVIALVFAIILGDKITCFGSPLISIPIIVFFCSILSIFGDLAASGIKREHEIKDYSNLIPGHGGIMDRFDSVIFISPVVYYLIIFLSEFL